MSGKLNIASINNARKRREEAERQRQRETSFLEFQHDRSNENDINPEDECNVISEVYNNEDFNEAYEEESEFDYAEDVETDEINADENFVVQMIDRHSIKRNEGNFYKLENIDELAMLISGNGLEQNLVVYKEEECYRLLSGERRYLATQKIFEESNGTRFQYLPCKVVEKPEDNADEVIKIIEGNQYRQLTDAEQYEAFLKLQEAVNEKIKNGEAIKKKTEYYAELLNLSKRQIGKFNRINRELTEEQKQAIMDGNLSISTAEKIIAKNNKLQDCEDNADMQMQNVQKTYEEKGNVIKETEQLSFLNKTLDAFSTLIKNAKKCMNSANSIARQEDAVRAEELANKIQKDMEELNSILNSINK